MNNKKSEKEIEQIKQQDYITNKLLLVFTFAFAFLVFIMILDGSKKNLEGFLALSGKVQKALWVSVAVLVAGIVWAVVEKFVTKRDTKYKLFTGVHIAVIGLFMTICMCDLNSKVMSTPDAFTRLYVAIPLAIVLYIIYTSYQLEFFMVSLASAVGGVAIWNMQELVYGVPDLVAYVAGVVILAICAVTALAQLGKLKLFKSGTKYGILYFSYALILALLAAAFMATGISVYFVFGIIGYVVLAGVYYTIKLI